MKKLLVIGSINMDFMLETDIIPIVGETVIGNNISYFYGGKGANQAVAAARMGVDVSFMGCVGDDVFGEESINSLNYEEINTDLVFVKESTPTGVALVTLSGGDNSIVIVNGANDFVDRKLILDNSEKIKKFDYILLQNEIPFEAIKEIINIANLNDIKVIYNPAPFKRESREVVDQVEYVTPNEIEAAGLGIIKDNVIITLGSKGVLVGGEIIKANKVPVVDTTGAGDTFNGVFVAFLMKGYELEEAIKMGQKAASLAIQKKGAQIGMPTLEDVQ